MSTKKDKIKIMMDSINFTDATKEQIEQSFAMANNSSLFKESYNKHFNWEEFESIVIPFYDESFTEQEIDDVLAFYGSDTGKKIMNFNISATSDMMKTLDKWVSERYNAVMDEITKTN